MHAGALRFREREQPLVERRNFADDVPVHARHHHERRAEPSWVRDELRRGDRNARCRGRALCDRLLLEVVVAEGPVGRRREPHDEFVHAFVAVVGPGEVDENRLARISDRRVLRTDHAHLSYAALLGRPARECVANDERIAMCQQRHEILVRIRLDTLPAVTVVATA